MVLEPSGHHNGKQKLIILVFIIAIIRATTTTSRRRAEGLDICPRWVLRELYIFYNNNNNKSLDIAQLLNVATSVTTSLDRSTVNKLSQSCLKAFRMNSSESLNSIVLTCLVNISVLLSSHMYRERIPQHRSYINKCPFTIFRVHFLRF